MFWTLCFGLESKKALKLKGFWTLHIRGSRLKGLSQYDIHLVHAEDDTLCDWHLSQADR